MRTLAALLALFGLAAPALASHACTGSAHCRVCTNCRYCRHCAVEGGTCSVKGHPKPATWKRRRRRMHSARK